VGAQGCFQHARAMVLEPQILLMDETLSALDQTEQFKLLALFEKLV
jgi:peptide/nickel transport system ATP-binding protein